MTDENQALKDALEQLKRLNAALQVVKEQANDTGLWSVPMFTKQNVVVAHLQQELRRLHRVLEGEDDEENSK